MAQTWVKIRKGKTYAQNATGDNPMSIEGRMALENERMAGMTELERAWRKKWLKDQELTAREPVFEAELALQQSLKNPIRRLYGAPADWLFKKFIPITGYNTAMYLRWGVPKLLISIFAVYATYYHFKYNQGTWEHQGGWHVYGSKSTVLPSDPNYPQQEEKKFYEHYDRGFSNRSVFTNIGPPKEESDED